MAVHPLTAKMCVLEDTAGFYVLRYKQIMVELKNMTALDVPRIWVMESFKEMYLLYREVMNEFTKKALSNEKPLYLAAIKEEEKMKKGAAKDLRKKSRAWWEESAMRLSKELHKELFPSQSHDQGGVEEVIEDEDEGTTEPGAKEMEDEDEFIMQLAARRQQPEQSDDDIFSDDDEELLDGSYLKKIKELIDRREAEREKEEQEAKKKRQEEEAKKSDSDLNEMLKSPKDQENGNDSSAKENGTAAPWANNEESQEQVIECDPAALLGTTEESSFPPPEPKSTDEQAEGVNENDQPKDDEQENDEPIIREKPKKKKKKKKVKKKGCYCKHCGCKQAAEEVKKAKRASRPRGPRKEKDENSKEVRLTQKRALEIEEFWHDNRMMTKHQIAKYFNEKYGINEQSCRRLIKKLERGGCAKYASENKGRPRINLPEDTVREIIEAARQDESLSMTQLAKRYKVHRRLIKRYLDSANIKRYNAKEVRMMRFAMRGEEYRPWNPKEVPEDRERLRERIRKYQQRKKLGLVIPNGGGRPRKRPPANSNNNANNANNINNINNNSSGNQESSSYDQPQQLTVPHKQHPQVRPAASSQQPRGRLQQARASQLHQQQAHQNHHHNSAQQLPGIQGSGSTARLKAHSGAPQSHHQHQQHHHHSQNYQMPPPDHHHTNSQSSLCSSSSFDHHGGTGDSGVSAADVAWLQNQVIQNHASLQNPSCSSASTSSSSATENQFMANLSQLQNHHHYQQMTAHFGIPTINYWPRPT